jgi:hypothetical protein
MKKWEYKTLASEEFGGIKIGVTLESLDATLNEMGAEGWELVVPTTVALTHKELGVCSTGAFIFKRPLE